jgi:hypothetical protein
MILCMTCKHDSQDYCLKGFLKRNADKECRYYERIKLYICGMITGDDHYHVKFLEAENTLYEAGFCPINPAALILANTDWNHAMKKAIGFMLQCDGVALLADWENSRGAKIENRLATELEIPVMPVDQWLSKRPMTEFPANNDD